MARSPSSRAATPPSRRPEELVIRPRDRAGPRAPPAGLEPATSRSGGGLPDPRSGRSSRANLGVRCLCIVRWMARTCWGCRRARRAEQRRIPYGLQRRPGPARPDASQSAAVAWHDKRAAHDVERRAGRITNRERLNRIVLLMMLQSNGSRTMSSTPTPSTTGCSPLTAAHASPAAQSPTHRASRHYAPESSRYLMGTVTLARSVWSPVRTTVRCPLAPPLVATSV